MTRADRYDYIGKFENKSENSYRNCKIFNTSVHFTETREVLEQSIIRSTDKPRYSMRPS